jgi:hypothetical protein
VNWTKEKPKTPGWYWLRANGMAATGVPIEVVEVSGECRMKLNAAGIAVTVPCAIMAMEWAGPIPEPAEPGPALAELEAEVRAATCGECAHHGRLGCGLQEFCLPASFEACSIFERSPSGKENNHA